MEKKLNIFISGQKFFGKEVFKAIVGLGHRVVGVCVPLTDSHLLPYVTAYDPSIKIVPGGDLNWQTMPDGVDLGICAHSFDYVGKRTRYKTALGWIGYHPSLLPRHRGRSSIDWALRMNDPITGGTVFWLNSGIDRGDIERQDWIWLDNKKKSSEIWREELLPLGVKLISDAVKDISSGKINKRPQDARFSTFEPSLDVKDIFRPDLLMLGDGKID